MIRDGSTCCLELRLWVSFIPPCCRTAKWINGQKWWLLGPLIYPMSFSRRNPADPTVMNVNTGFLPTKRIALWIIVAVDKKRIRYASSRRPSAVNNPKESSRARMIDSSVNLPSSYTEPVYTVHKSVLASRHSNKWPDIIQIFLKKFRSGSQVSHAIHHYRTVRSVNEVIQVNTKRIFLDCRA